MTNKPNTDKTIEQLKQKMVSEIIETERRTGVGWGSDEALSLIIDGAVDAAIQLSEQRERDLVENIESLANKLGQDILAVEYETVWGDPNNVKITLELTEDLRKRLFASLKNLVKTSRGK